MSVQAQRLTSQLLAGTTARSAHDVADHLLAVQAQEPRGFRLGVRARAHGVTAASIDAELDAGSVVVTWLNRGTLHLVTAEDCRWLNDLTTPQLATSNATRLRQEGVTLDEADRAVAALRKAIATHGPQTRIQLRDVAMRANVRTAGQAFIHILFRAAITGAIVRGPMRGVDHAYVIRDDWLPVTPAIDRDAALERLARRYLASHQPATDRDFARWAGIALGVARTALTHIGNDIDRLDCGCIALRSKKTAKYIGKPQPPTHLLGPFDPCLLGWVSRTPILGELDGTIVRGGAFSAFVMESGTAAGLWRNTNNGPEISLTRPLNAAARAEVQREATAVVTFMGGAARRSYRM